MLKNSIVLFLLVFSSCANTSEYVTVLLPNKNMTWRFCSIIDSELNNKGFCFITKKCKDKFIGKKCKKHTLFCAWEDLDCKMRYALKEKKLRN